MAVERRRETAYLPSIDSEVLSPESERDQQPRSPLLLASLVTVNQMDPPALPGDLLEPVKNQSPGTVQRLHLDK